MDTQAISSDEKNSYQLLHDKIFPLGKLPGIELIFFPDYADFRIRVWTSLLPKHCQASLIEEACKLLQIKKNLPDQKVLMDKQEKLINQLCYYIKNKSVSIYKLVVLGSILGPLVGTIPALFICMAALSAGTIMFGVVATVLITVAVGVITSFLIAKCINYFRFRAAVVAEKKLQMLIDECTNQFPRDSFFLEASYSKLESLSTLSESSSRPFFFISSSELDNEGEDRCSQTASMDRTGCAPS